MRAGLSNNKIQYTNAEGQVITTTSSSTRKSLERQLDQAIERQNIINSKIDTLNQRLFDYETEIVEVSTGNDIAGELGPLKYLSGLTGIPMDQIINYLLLTIIFVFDPLAIALVIAANYAFEQLRSKTKQNLYGERVPVEEQAYGGDWDSTINDGVEDEEWEEEPNEELKQAAKSYKKKTLEENGESQLENSINGLEEKYDEFDLNKDGVLSEEELRAKEDIILNTSSFSSWRKKKILRDREERNNDDLTKTY